MTKKDQPEMNSKIREALGLLASVIKSGEPWTEHCEKALQEALAALDDGWIPVSERLPEHRLKGCWVWGRLSKHESDAGYHCWFDGKDFYTEQIGEHKVDALKWRELPPPPKDTSDD